MISKYAETIYFIPRIIQWLKWSKRFHSSFLFCELCHKYQLEKSIMSPLIRRIFTRIELKNPLFVECNYWKHFLTFQNVRNYWVNSYYFEEAIENIQWISFHRVSKNWICHYSHYIIYSIFHMLILVGNVRYKILMRLCLKD